jgi:D-3-phosphoglycerate dehydrogenase / 2-oxoglutarate reductase
MTTNRQVLYIPTDGKLYAEPAWFAPRFAEEGLTLIRGDSTISEAENAARGPDAQVLLVGAGRYPVTALSFDRMRACRLAIRMGAGFDTIDVAEATRRRVMVANMPAATAEEVSDHAVALYLACLRRLLPHTLTMRAGRWESMVAYGTPRVRRQTLGLVGFGRIARAVAKKIGVFGVQCMTHDPYIDPAEAAGAGVEWVPFDELLRRSDAISIHAPANVETRHMFDAATFAKMKPGAILINTSRGFLVDERALVAALREGRLQAAGLDVFEREPTATDNPLLQLDNVILTPHVASYSVEGLEDYWRAGYQLVNEFLLQEKVPASVVNPEVLRQ